MNGVEVESLIDLSLAMAGPYIEASKTNTIFSDEQISLSLLFLQTDHELYNCNIAGVVEREVEDDISTVFPLTLSL